MTTSDYVIVGGGVVGVWAAYHLAMRGREVVLLERKGLAPPAPWSSSGDLVKQFRSASGASAFLTDLSSEALRWWRQIEAQSGQALLTPTGWLIFDADRDETRARWPAYALPPAGFASQSASVMERAGLAFDRLDKNAVRDRFAMIADNGLYDWALLDKTAALLHAREAVNAIGALAVDAGAEIRTETTVHEVARHGDDVVRIATSQGDIVPKRAVIFAAGYMNLGFAPELRRKARVTRERLLFLRPPDPDAYAPARFPIVHHYAFPLHGDGVVKVAAGEDPLSEIIDPTSADPAADSADGVPAAYVERARGVLREWIPALAAAEIVRGQTCMYVSTQDGRYLVYRRGNAVVVSACSGVGFKHGPVTGLLGAELALTEDPSGFRHPFYSEDLGYDNAPDIGTRAEAAESQSAVAGWRERD